ncbi:hypothetical protein QTP88_020490 [Uroleucon formosanum]
MDKFLKRKHDSGTDNASTNTSNVNDDTFNDENKIKKVNRQYCNDYLNFGFTYVDENDCQIPLCVVCGEKLSNSAMAPAKLKRHFSSKHANLQSKEKNYFERLLNNQMNQRKHFKKIVTISDKAQIASYKVAEIIAKQLKPHTIAESLILPACSEIVQIMFGDDAKKEIMKIPHSDDTIKNRIIHMSDDIEKTVTNKLTTNKLYFALQIDESTDISGIAHVLGFVRFIDENKIVNQFLCCKQLTERTTGQNVFDSISSYLDKFNITWDQCVGICTDGAPSMSVLDKIVSMVNYIKSRPLQSRLFKKLCESMEAQHVCLLLHCEVRWLSRGKVLNRILELKNELLMFFQNEEHLALLEEKITKYFPELNIEKYDWIRNLFSTINTSSYEFTLEEEEEFITLTTDRTLKIKFSEITVEEFWISVQTEFKKNSEKAISILLQFSTSYLCELGFSTLTNIKTKKRERLTNIEEEMRVAISYIRPDIENIYDGIAKSAVYENKSVHEKDIEIIPERVSNAIMDKAIAIDEIKCYLTEVGLPSSKSLK